MLLILLQKCPATEEPSTWFVFAGMGSQWPGMGRKLMTLDRFRQSIQTSDRTLQPYGVKLCDMIMSGEQTTFENTLYAFVGIAAIQVRILAHILWIKLYENIMNHTDEKTLQHFIENASIYL